MSLLNWNAGNLQRNPSLLEFMCGNCAVGLIQEASTTLGQSLANYRSICWSDAPDGDKGNLAVLAGCSGSKLVSPTYGLFFHGKIIRPHLERWTERTRLGAAWFYTVDVEWRNANGDRVNLVVLGHTFIFFWPGTCPNKSEAC